MMLTSLMGTLSGGVSLENVTPPGLPVTLVTSFSPTSRVCSHQANSATVISSSDSSAVGWMTLPALLAMAAVGGLAVGVPAVSMMLTSLMGNQRRT
jgi:hypothetical protein